MINHTDIDNALLLQPLSLAWQVWCMHGMHAANGSTMHRHTNTFRHIVLLLIVLIEGFQILKRQPCAACQVSVMFLSTHSMRLLQLLMDLRVACAGLDSFAALNIMDHMACLAALGHTVIATLHQPRTAIWDMIHKVPLIAAACQTWVSETNIVIVRMHPGSPGFRTHATVCMYFDVFVPMRNVPVNGLARNDEFKIVPARHILIDKSIRQDFSAHAQFRVFSTCRWW